MKIEANDDFSEMIFNLVYLDYILCIYKLIKKDKIISTLIPMNNNNVEKLRCKCKKKLNIDFDNINNKIFILHKYKKYLRDYLNEFNMDDIVNIIELIQI